MAISVWNGLRALAVVALVVASANAQLPTTSIAAVPVVDAFATETGGVLLSIPGVADDIVLFADGAFDVRPNGTARLSAFAHKQSSFDREFYVTLELSGRLAPADVGYPPANSPVVTMLPTAYVPSGPVDPATFVYFTQVTGSMVGLRSFAGARIDVSAATPIQVGFGANNKNVRLGLAGDLTLTVAQQPSGAPLSITGPAQLRAELAASTSFCLAHVDGNAAASGNTNRAAIDLPGLASDYIFVPAGTWFDNADGSATIVASVRRQSDYSDRWQLQLQLSNRVIPGAAAHPPAGLPSQQLLPATYAAQGGAVDPSGFRYYTIASGTLTGAGINAGGLVTLSSNVPFQVGHGAGQGNLFFGVDGTVAVAVTTQPTSRTITPTGTMRLQANLSTDCLLPKPVITSGQLQQSDSLTHQRLVYHGPELGFVTQGVFGSRFLGLDERRWYEGHLRVTAHDTIELSIPQGMAPGQYPLWLLNQTTLSAPATVDVVAPAERTLRTENDRFAGEPQHWLVHQGGNHPGFHFTFLAISTSNVPSVAPGLVDLQIGNGFAELFLLDVVINDAITGIGTVILPAIPANFAGFRLYAQAALMDNTFFPLLSSDVWFTDY